MKYVRNKGKDCSVAECVRGAYSLGYCSLHYDRFKRHGDPNFVSNSPPGSSLEETLRYHGWLEVDRVPELGPCWEYQGVMNTRNPYGVVYSKGSRMRAHRAAYTVWNGPIPDGLLVCHACDNPPCINPAHLWVGTASENVHDSILKGRAVIRRGTERRNSILSDEQVIAAKRARKAGESLSALAREFGVNRQTLSKASQPDSWIHLEKFI